jgi:CubicO group peptidase (beta-lactamase class C family)
MKNTLCILFSFLLFSLGITMIPGTLSAQKTKPPQTSQESIETKVDKLFAEWDKWDSPGAALAVVKDGRIVYKRGYGSANLEYNIPITPSTIFHVASVSKQFTAFAITMLANQGKLSLDDDIHKYLPEVPDFGKTITIKHLIRHTSGMRDQWQLLAMAGWRLDDVITKEHIMKMVRNQNALNFNPGEEYLYCNTGYTLLAAIVERVTGQSFREWTQANIFKPLGMSNTHFHDDHEMIVKNRAYSYASVKDKGFKKSVLSYANVGATSLFTTVEDLAKWIQNLDEGRVGGAAVIEQMHEQGILNSGKKIDYAFGLVVGKHKGLKRVGHSGGDAGFRSHVVRFPDQKFGVAILSNLSSFSPARQAMKVADIYLADQIPPQKLKEEERKVAKVDPAVFDAYVGKYQLKIGMLISITKEDDRLKGEVAGEPKFELFPESETKFFLKIIDAQITFHRDEKGKVTGFTLHQASQDMSAKKIIPPTLSPEQLAEFAGDYYSDELGTTYTVEVKDGKLVAQHRRHNDVDLTPTDVDQFAGDKWWFSRVHFMRSENKKITGFKLGGGRVRNLRFDKR